MEPKLLCLFPPGTWRRQKPDNYQLQTPHWQSFWNKQIMQRWSAKKLYNYFPKKFPKTLHTNRNSELPLLWQSRDLNTNTGFRLVQTDHVTWILVPDWSLTYHPAKVWCRSRLCRARCLHAGPTEWTWSTKIMSTISLRDHTGWRQISEIMYLYR